MQPYLAFFHLPENARSWNQACMWQQGRSEKTRNEMALSRRALPNLMDLQWINDKIMHTNSGRGVNRVAFKDYRGNIFITILKAVERNQLSISGKTKS